MPKKKTAKRPTKTGGRPTQRLKLPGDDWQANLKTFIRKRKPAGGWPKPETAGGS